ncbi:hypothetical protein HY213_03445 [Candidatus Peregrinibacteria bacterium]|nr:hypothetical protein [Candidatus Peregrinibacteria bacterium]
MSLCAVTIGADLKITEKGDVAIMELNGTNAWMEGFRILYGGALIAQRREFLEAERARMKNSMRWLFFHEHPAYAKALHRENEPLGDPHNAWNPHGLSILCKDKGSQRWCIPEQYSPPHEVFRGENRGALMEFITKLQSGNGSLNGNPTLLNLSRFPYLVAKESWGTVGGEGVNMYGIHDVDEILRFAEGKEWSIVVEGFVPSRPLYHNKTNQLHEGAMRLHVDYLVDEERQTLQTLFEKSYWKLCGAPLQSSEQFSDWCISHSGGYVADLLQPVSSDDHKAAKEALDATMRNLLLLDPDLLNHVEHEGVLL